MQSVILKILLILSNPSSAEPYFNFVRKKQTISVLRDYDIDFNIDFDDGGKLTCRAMPAGLRSLALG